jgi:hypothetical protein
VGEDDKADQHDPDIVDIKEMAGGLLPGIHSDVPRNQDYREMVTFREKHFVVLHNDGGIPWQTHEFITDFGLIVTRARIATLANGGRFKN